MYNLDVCVARKIRLVQGKNMRNRVNLHGGRKSRIVDLYPADTIAHDQISPDPIDLFVVWKQGHDALNRVDTRIRFLNRQTKTVVPGWACTYVPKLTYILGSVAQVRPAFYEDLSSGLHNSIVWVVFFGESEQNVRINEVSRPVRH
jgi:hypothetical protein